MILASLAMAGCTPKGNTPLPQADPRPAPAEARVEKASTKGGSAIRYSDSGVRMALWSVAWGEATLEYDQKGNVGGEMARVEGRLFQKGVEASAFEAGGAKAEFGTRNLSLSNGVRVKIDDPPSILTGDRVVWNPDLERIEAHGKVMLQTNELTFGPFETMYASPDLKEISTPDLFRKTK